MRFLEQANSETESKSVVARVWGEGRRGNYCLMGSEF